MSKKKRRYIKVKKEKKRKKIEIVRKNREKDEILNDKNE